MRVLTYDMAGEVDLEMDVQEAMALYTILEPFATIRWPLTESGTVPPRMKQLHWMFWQLHTALFPGDA